MLACVFSKKIMIVKEYCIENLANIEAVCASGEVSRLELCDRLDLGGVSVLNETLKKAIEIAHTYSVDVFPIVRPRPGDFFYQLNELKQMVNFAKNAIKLGADGLVLGCNKIVKENNCATTDINHTTTGIADNDNSSFEIDTKAIGYIIDNSQIDPFKFPLTFHMAFDELSDPYTSITNLSRLGFTRILTHGGPLSDPINIELLKSLIDYRNENRLYIEVMPGGGVTWENYHEIATKTGAKQVHGSKIIKL